MRETITVKMQINHNTQQCQFKKNGTEGNAKRQKDKTTKRQKDKKSQLQYYNNIVLALTLDRANIDNRFSFRNGM